MAQVGTRLALCNSRCRAAVGRHRKGSPRKCFMLVLSRREQEAICIGSDVVVTVAEIRAKTVRLAIDAPADTPVHRFEVRSRIDEALRVAEVHVGKVGSTESAHGNSLPALDPPKQA